MAGLDELFTNLSSSPSGQIGLQLLAGQDLGTATAAGTQAARVNSQALKKEALAGQALTDKKKQKQLINDAFTQIQAQGVDVTSPDFTPAFLKFIQGKGLDINIALETLGSVSKLQTKPVTPLSKEGKLLADADRLSLSGRTDAANTLLAAAREPQRKAKAAKDKTDLATSKRGQALNNTLSQAANVVRTVDETLATLDNLTEPVGGGLFPKEGGVNLSALNPFSDDELFDVSDPTGFGASNLSAVGGTDAKVLQTKLNTLEANLGFDKLQAMRDASPTGGALGQVSDRELTLLKAALTSLDIGLPTAILKKNLARVKEHYNNLIVNTKRIQEFEASGLSQEQFLNQGAIKSDSIPTVASQADFDSLPKGARFLDQGKEFIK